MAGNRRVRLVQLSDCTITHSLPAQLLARAHTAAATKGVPGSALALLERGAGRPGTMGHADSWAADGAVAGAGAVAAAAGPAAPQPCPPGGGGGLLSMQRAMRAFAGWCGIV